MKLESPRRWLVPVFFIACIVLGGSAQGIWLNMALQLAALGLLAWALLSRRSDELTSASRQLLILLALTAVVIALQLIPLPPDVWTALPGREPVATGYRALGYSLPNLPLSLTPYETVSTILVLLPALAVLVGILRIRQRESWLAAALLLATVAAVLLGALQVAGGGPTRSPWYLYPLSNNRAVGFFANSNHMGSMLLVSIPFAMAVFASFASRAGKRSPRGGLIAIGGAALAVIATGVALNRSLAAAGLAIPVLLFSTLLLPATLNIRRLALVTGTLALVGSVIVLSGSPIAADAAAGNIASIESRAGIWESTVELIRQTFPFGSGLGSFDSVYPLTEAPAQVRQTYVNHAHNDYLQIVLELGIAGIFLLLLFLIWWVVQVVAVWRSPLSTHYARAATIATAAVLAHSIVDYPLRTAAMSAIFAMCLGLMSQPRRERQSGDDPQARPTKHVTLG
ncbi:MAG: O-antigen ligase family protein [Pseudomonadota bacterium]|nr:O-antigen ligase family protein [Pseudomonadota bacterium]